MTPDPLFSGKPVPLRKVPFITNWPMDLFADILTDNLGAEFLFISPYDWVMGQPPRRVSAVHMQEILGDIKELQDPRDRIARLPARFFVWSNDLANGLHLSCVYLHDDSCPYQLDWNPSVYPCDDLIAECPDFLSNTLLTDGAAQTKRDLRKQETLQLHARLQARAGEVRRAYPGRKETQIARDISRESLAEGLEPETIRKIIRNR